MAQYASALPMPLASEPEPLPVSAVPVAAVPMAAVPDPVDLPAPWPGDAHRRPLDVAQCSLCGIALPLGLLVPDGGAACADVRWYCKDARSCTDRWTAGLPGRARPSLATGT